MAKETLDFTNVKEGGNFTKKHLPAGDYKARITKFEATKPKDKSDNAKMWLFTIAIEGRHGATYPYYCKLVENQLWKVRNLLVAAGINVPKKKVAVDPERLVGKLIGVTLDDTEYEGREQSEVSATFPASEVEVTSADVDDDDDDDDEDEDEEPAPKKAKKKAPPVEDDEDEDDDEGSEDDDDDDDEPEPPKKSKKSKGKKKAKPADDDDDDDDEDLDELDIEEL